MLQATPRMKLAARSPRHPVVACWAWYSQSRSLRDRKDEIRIENRLTHRTKTGVPPSRCGLIRRDILNLDRPRDRKDEIRIEKTTYASNQERCSAFRLYTLEGVTLHAEQPTLACLIVEEFRKTDCPLQRDTTVICIGTYSITTRLHIVPSDKTI